MDQGWVAVRGESQVTDNGGDAKLVRAEHKAYGNGNKPAEGCLPGETGFKLAQDFINKIQHNRMVNHQKVWYTHT